MRGSPHIHMFIWLKDSPVLSESANDQVLDFVDKYVTCTRDAGVEDTVDRQQHRHSRTC